MSEYRSPWPEDYPQKTTGHERVVRCSDRGTIRSSLYGKERGVTMYDSTERYPRSVLEYSKDVGGVHPTQKPLALCEYLIGTYTDPGDVVLDNCAGSGTTLVAALRTGRRFIGYELDPVFFDAVCVRIQAEGG